MINTSKLTTHISKNMKKMIASVLLALVMCFAFSLTSCNGCGSSTVDEPKDTIALVDTNKVINVEKTIATDREYMYLNFAKDYRWFETCILLKDYMDEECDGAVASVTSIFQVVTEVGSGFDTKVVMSNHDSEGSNIDVKDGFWIEDCVLNDEVIKVSYQEAFEKMMATNMPKPHSKHCVLRKEVGPKDANPQYIFGNTRAQIYVDATTGKVSDKNPVFEGTNFGTPLGEWP